MDVALTVPVDEVVDVETVGDIIVKWLKYWIYVVIGVCLVMSLIGKAFAKSVGSDNVRPFGILFFSLYAWDFYSDIMFAVRLWDAAESMLFAVAASSICIPWSMNLVLVFKSVQKWETDKSLREGVRGWLISWSCFLYSAVVLSGNGFGAVEIANVCIQSADSPNICIYICPCPHCSVEPVRTGPVLHGLEPSPFEGVPKQKVLYLGAV